MALYKTTGIVIGRTNFGEADRIIRLMTNSHGKISIIAKGVRKIKSRSAGHLELLGEVELMLAEGKNLDVVTSARLVWYPHELAEDYSRLERAFMFATMVDRLLEEHQSQPEIYSLLSDGLHALNDGHDILLVELWFKLRLLRGLGYQPDLASCVVCGENSAEASYYFSPERGGILDDTCRNATSRPMSRDTIKLWRLIVAQPAATIAKIDGVHELAAESLRDCDEFYGFHLGRSFGPEISGVKRNE